MDTKQANEAAVDRAKEAIEQAIKSLFNDTGLIIECVSVQHCCQRDRKGKVLDFDTWDVTLALKA